MFRINAKRFVALPVLCLVVAVAAAGAQGSTTPSCMQAGLVKVCVSPNYMATFSFATKTKTTASVSIGLDNVYPETVMDVRGKTSHTINIPVTPATKYNFKVTATPLKGKPTTWKSSFTTNGYGASTPLNIAARGSKITLNGQPFFVIANKGLCPVSETVKSTDMIGYDVKSGINVEEAVSSGCPDGTADPTQNTSALHGVLNGQVGWRDIGGSSQPPLAIPELLNWSAGIRVTIQPPNALLLCGAKWDSTEQLDQMISQYSKTGPVIYSTIVSDAILAPIKSCLDDLRVENVVLTVYEAGGSGLETVYETRKGGSVQQEMQPAVQSGLKESSDQIKSLEAVFGNGKAVTVKTTACTSVHPRFVTYGGVLYGLAVNNDDTSANCTFTLPKNAGLLAQRLWERGSVRLKTGVFSDTFAPLGHHWYKIMPAVKK